MTLNFHNTQFETSASKMSECPGAIVPEIVFAGRSNAGKSTAINTLCKQRQLAYASKTPGRTQLLNFFTVQLQGQVIARLVDLPGYGFAQLAQTSQTAWDRELGGYLADRGSLKGCVLIVDSRRGLQELDLALLDWVSKRQLAVHIVLSKSDKLTRQEQVLCKRKVEAQVKPYVELGQPVSVQLWSALKKAGIETLELRLSHWISPEQFPTPEAPPAKKTVSS